MLFISTFRNDLGDRNGGYALGLRFDHKTQCWLSRAREFLSPPPSQELKPKINKYRSKTEISKKSRYVFTPKFSVEEIYFSRKENVSDHKKLLYQNN